MNKHMVISLKNERNFLLSEWSRADGDERVKILVKIMDIDEAHEANINYCQSENCNVNK